MNCKLILKSLRFVSFNLGPIWVSSALTSLISLKSAQQTLVIFSIVDLTLLTKRNFDHLISFLPSQNKRELIHIENDRQIFFWYFTHVPVSFCFNYNFEYFKDKLAWGDLSFIESYAICEKRLHDLMIDFSSSTDYRFLEDAERSIYSNKATTLKRPKAFTSGSNQLTKRVNKVEFFLVLFRFEMDATLK